MNMDQFIVRPGPKSTVEKEQIVNVHRTVKGFYKASIMEPDANGNINEAFSTGWKPNTILNSGLDKVAYMPWAQTFQFCIIGDYPYTGADPATASFDETMLKRPTKIHTFYLPGQGNCGHVVSGSTVRLFRTFDFYRETDNVTYTEVGFKESPAANTLFSKIRFDPVMSLHAGQFMRVSYELRVNLNPASSTPGGFTPSPFPTFTGWTSGSGDKEAIQKIGLCGIDSSSGLAIPIDEGGFCNEPFAPGQLSFGPAFGFVNRWYNGSRVNYYPYNSVSGSVTGSTSASYETNPFKAIGPLQEFNAGYENIYQLLDLGMSHSLVINGGRNSGSFCVPGTSSFLPRNYFTPDMIFGGYYNMGSSSIYSTFYWYGGSTPDPFGTFDTVNVDAKSGTEYNKLAFTYDVTGGDEIGKFTNLDNLWTPYCKIATLTSISGSNPLYYERLHNTNMFCNTFYDPSMQTNGGWGYPVYPSKLAVPGGIGTGSAYEPIGSFDGDIPLPMNNGGWGGKSYNTLGQNFETKNARIKQSFPYWDDWNPFIVTSSLPPIIRNVSNYWVRGTNVFLSTHSGSPTLFTASVDRSSNTSSKIYSVELAATILPYTQSNFYRDKFVIFNNALGNNEDIPTSYWSGSSYPAWRTIGIGPTSLSINPSTMNDAAKYNGYVYVLENPQIKDKDYSLKLIFRYSWGRA